MSQGDGVSRRWMFRFGFAAVGAALAGGGSAAMAEDFWARCKLDWRRNNFWPRPFVVADREASRQPFDVQANVGWRLQNTMGNDFFDATTGELTPAGVMKVKWILTYAPSHRRTVYVLATGDQAATMARVDSVQRTIADTTAINGTQMPQVLLTDHEPPGGSGTYYEAIQRAYQSSIPAPRLPQSQSSGGSGGGGSGSSGGSGT